MGARRPAHPLNLIGAHPERDRICRHLRSMSSPRVSAVNAVPEELSCNSDTANR